MDAQNEIEPNNLYYYIGIAVVTTGIILYILK